MVDRGTGHSVLFWSPHWLEISDFWLERPHRLWCRVMGVKCSTVSVALSCDLMCFVGSFSHKLRFLIIWKCNVHLMKTFYIARKMWSSASRSCSAQHALAWSRALSASDPCWCRGDVALETMMDFPPTPKIALPENLPHSGWFSRCIRIYENSCHY